MYIKSLSYEAQPDYQRLYSLLTEAKVESCAHFRAFDWDVK
jgi:hypothetical protein